MWLTSNGAPLDCRLVPKAGWQGVRKAGTSKGQNEVKARWIGDDPRVISHSDPSSGDSIEPIRSQVSKHPPGMVDVYCEEPTTAFLPTVLLGGSRGYIVR